MTAPGSFSALLGGDAPAGTDPGDPTLRSRFTRPAVTLPVVVLLLAAALAVVLVARGPAGPGPGEAIVQIDGTARLVRADGSASTVTGSVRLEPGDRLAVRAGTASFELARGVRYEGRGRGDRIAGTTVKMGNTPDLEAGPLLVTTVAQPTAVRSGSALASFGPGSAARLERSLALRLDAYRGPAQLTSAGVERRIAPLHSADAVGNGELSDVQPLRYAATDRWDRRFLPDAIYLDEQLDPLERGVEASGLNPGDLLTEVRTRIGDRPSPPRLQRMVEGREVGIDLAVGVAVVGSGDPATPLTRRFDRGFSFHDDGARWGLVAMGLGADPSSVLEVLRGALDGRSLAGALDLTGFAQDASTAGVPGAEGGPSPADPINGAGNGIDPATGAPTVPDGSAPGSAAPGVSPGGDGTTVTIPGVNVPGPPGVTVPGVPGVTLPPVKLPPVKLPPVNVPPVVVTLPGGIAIGTPPVQTPPILGPVLGGVNGTVGGVTGTVDGAVGGVTSPLGGLLGP